MLRNILNFFLILFVVANAKPNNQFSKRVINGKNAPVDKYLWAVSLKGDIHNLDSFTACGASIIDKQWLLTAANCFLLELKETVLNLTDPSLWHARIGAKTIDMRYIKDEHKDVKNDKAWSPEINDENLNFDDDWNKLRTKRRSNNYLDLHIEKIILHPKYKSKENGWDIALMKLKTPIEDEYFEKSIEIIKLPENINSKTWPSIGQICILIGWGCKRNGCLVLETAQIAKLKIQTNKYCKNVFNLNDEPEFCAGSYKSGHGLCDGDSGSGLSCKNGDKWLLAGVAFAIHAEMPGKYPALFTRVTDFIPWILENINGK